MIVVRQLRWSSRGGVHWKKKRKWNFFFKLVHSSIFTFNHAMKYSQTISIQRTQTPPRLWPLALLCDLDLSSRSRKLMSFDVAYCCIYLGTRHDVYWFITLRVMTICLFYVTFDLHLWPSAFAKVTGTLIIIDVYYAVECLYQKWSL